MKTVPQQQVEENNCLNKLRLKAAEAKLMKIASSKFGKDTLDDLSLFTFDTKIPSRAVPIQRSMKRLKTKEQGQGRHRHHHQQDNYLMHAARVTRLNATGTGTSEDPASGAATTQTPLVLLHGFMCGMCYWYRSFASLSNYFPDIYAVDLLGFGSSSRPKWPRKTGKDEDFQIAEDFFVNSLEAWRAANNIDRLILVGHSFSGYISVAYCERFPHRVEQLILVGALGVTDFEALPTKQTESQRILHQNPHGHRMKATICPLVFALIHKNVFQAGAMNGHILRKLPKGIARRCVVRDVKRYCTCLAEEEQEALAEYLYCCAQLQGSAEYTLHRLFFPSLYARKPTQHRISRLQIKDVAIVYGENDWIDTRGAEALVNNSQHCVNDDKPNISFYEVEGTGHRPMLDSPLELTAALVQIVKTATERRTAPVP